MTEPWRSGQYVLIVGDPKPEYTRSRSLKRGIQALGLDVSRSQRGRGRPVAVLVPYPGWFYLVQGAVRSRLLRCPLIFDYFISATETRALERQRSRAVVLAYRIAETMMLLLPHVLIFDTAESLAENARYCLRRRQSRLVVPVTAGIGEVTTCVADRPSRRLRVVWYGTFNELHGAPVIAAAATLIERADVTLTLIGSGRLDREVTWPSSTERCEVVVRPEQNIDSLTAHIAEADVVLGVFGGTPKADHVIPNKVVDGLAAARAVITQRSRSIEPLISAGAVLTVAPRDPRALATAIEQLAADGSAVAALASRGRQYYAQHMSAQCVERAVEVALRAKWRP